MPISDELKRVYASAPDDVYYYETLTLEHSGLTGGIKYLTNIAGGFSGQLENGDPVTYEYVPFTAIPPTSEEENNLNLQIAFDNAARQLMAELEQMAANPVEPIRVTYRVYLSTDLNTVQNDPPLKLEILGVRAQQLTVSASAGLANLRRRRFPATIYSLDKFPGLTR